jgi:hypothetical protein
MVVGFTKVIRFPPPLKHTSTEILLKVALYTINQANLVYVFVDRRMYRNVYVT